ncbi:MAG: hypothetical protein Kow0075_01230 [Salibacteraceae bacterium]
MRVVLIGSKQLSVDMLRALVENGYSVAAVFSRDSEPGMAPWLNTLGHESLAAVARGYGIPVYEGVKVNSAEGTEIFESARADVIFSCFWGEIIKEEVLALPRLGAFNLHTALLPKHRGSRPIPWAIIEGDEIAGITLHKMLSGVDNGPIVAQRSVKIAPDDTALTLYNRVCEEGKQLFTETLPQFTNGTFTLTRQNSDFASYHLRGEPYGGQINPLWPEDFKERFRRAFTFPPFKSWAPPPAGVEPGRPGIYVAHVDLHALIQPQVADLLMVEESKTLRNRLRSELRGMHKPLYIPISSRELRSRHRLLDLLRELEVPYIFTQPRKSSEKLNLSDIQPFRHVNGVLELPLIEFVQGDELNGWVKLAQTAALEWSYDVFILSISLPQRLPGGIKRINAASIANSWNQALDQSC